MESSSEFDPSSEATSSECDMEKGNLNAAFFLNQRMLNDLAKDRRGVIENKDENFNVEIKAVKFS